MMAPEEQHKLTFDTILLLDSFGHLNAHVRTGDQVLIRAEQLATLIPVFERNQLLYEEVPYPGLHKTMLVLSKN